MLDIKNINDLDNLFDLIPCDQSGNKPVFDGIVNIEKYINSKYKILWVLKEANDTSDGGNWDMRDDFLSNSQFKKYARWKTTFSIILSITYGLLNDFVSWEELPELDEIDGNILENIAYINLKKIPGGAQANETKIYEAYQKSKQLIMKQIELYAPDFVIITGNKLSIMAGDLGIDQYNIKSDIQNAKYTKHNDIVFIDTFHPAQRKIKHQDFYESIMQACQMGLSL